MTVLEASATLARAVSDEADCLVSADEPLAGLQLQCGGEIPGTVAIPALLEIVRKSRRYQLKLARTINAQTDAERVTARIEVAPRSDDELGCEIRLLSWSADPLPPEAAARTSESREEIDRQVAEFSAMLDGNQSVLTFETAAPDLANLAEAMRGGTGQAWTDFVEIAGMSHRQPMHWRLLDGAQVVIAGSQRTWRAVLVPLARPRAEPTGFELLLVPNEPLAGQTASLETAPERERADGMRGLVGDDIAPVLKQPLARIIANAETIRTRLAGPLADEYAEYAAEIATAGKHLLGLLDDLADLEVVEADDFTVEADLIDLAEVARQSAGILGVRAKEKSIYVDAPKMDESLWARAEFRRAMQILLNLIGNAIRYSPEGSEVWVRLETAGTMARATVADQGPGLSEEDCEAVFEKFERLGRSGDGGSGLGLYISRKLARAMNGDLKVESAPGQGARFVLELPYVSSNG